MPNRHIETGVKQAAVAVHPGNGTPLAKSGGFYIRSLDGIRAISVMLVFWSHMELGHFFPGLFGVNVFFFLSGLLITTLMIREHNARSRMSIKEFYLRRALRILPPMYIVLGTGVALTAAGLLPGPLDRFSVIMQGLHLTNYYVIFGHPHFISGLGVYWSLAVEEHFYLFFPFVFVLCFSRLGPKRMAAMLLGLALIVMFWRVALVLNHPISPARTWAATDTRIDSILWGCVLALWRNPTLDPASAQGLGSLRNCVLALAVLAATFAFYSNDFFRETFRYTLESICLIPLFCAAILKGESPLVRLLNVKPVRWLGQVSYVLYLSHLMFFQLIRGNFPQLPRILTALVTLGCTLIFCQVIRLAVEIPLAQIRKRHSQV